MTGEGARVHVFMAMEGPTGRTPGRVLMQARPITDADIPPGLEGHGWTFREGDVDRQLWDAELGGQLDDEQSDALHRDTWTRSGDTPWPNP